MALSQKWIDTVEDGLSNREWDAYDTLIRSEVGECVCSAQEAGYNPRFIENTASGYVCVDWTLVKAMLWVESGGPRQACWKTRPMQIGNPGDAAYGVLKSGAEGSVPVMSPKLFNAIRTQSIDSPELNIRAAIAYLFTRMAKFDVQTVPDESDQTIHSVTVVHGDSLERIARRVGTSIDELKKFRSEVSITQLRIGEKLRYRKMKTGRVIVGWRKWDFVTIAARYNGGGDPAYADKLAFVANLFPRLKR